MLLQERPKLRGRHHAPCPPPGAATCRFCLHGHAPLNFPFQPQQALASARGPVALRPYLLPRCPPCWRCSSPARRCRCCAWQGRGGARRRAWHVRQGRRCGPRRCCCCSRCLLACTLCAIAAASPAAAGGWQPPSTVGFQAHGSDNWCGSAPALVLAWISRTSPPAPSVPQSPRPSAAGGPAAAAAGAASGPAAAAVPRAAAAAAAAAGRAPGATAEGLACSACPAGAAAPA
mmetsp:Transcript_7910/g.19411  ORF Transcript_7910/g.19411 Transcript_7910/m.19411 type:complete len:232 (+) Transcript_7910:1194-1889(+)